MIPDSQEIAKILQRGLVYLSPSCSQWEHLHRAQIPHQELDTAHRPDLTQSSPALCASAMRVLCHAIRGAVCTRCTIRCRRVPFSLRSPFTRPTYPPPPARSWPLPTTNLLSIREGYINETQYVTFGDWFFSLITRPLKSIQVAGICGVDEGWIIFEIEQSACFSSPFCCSVWFADGTVSFSGGLEH